MQILRTIKIFYKDKLAFWLLNFSILFILATWILFLFKNIVRSPISVLHYNIYSGIDIIGNWHWLYIIPLIVLLCSLLDFILAVLLWIKHRIWSYFLLAVILLLNIVTFIYLYNIINYNLLNYNI